MADIKLVIKIPEEKYKWIKENILKTNKNSIVKAIANGTPLPKGHGRIGDLDALRKEVSSWGMNDYEPSDFTDAIDQADTIIEANNEEKDGNDDYSRFCLKCSWNDPDYGCTSPSGEEIWQCPMYIHYHPAEVEKFNEDMNKWLINETMNKWSKKDENDN